jgi:hypothetical protein
MKLAELNLPAFGVTVSLFDSKHRLEAPGKEVQVVLLATVPKDVPQ